MSHKTVESLKRGLLILQHLSEHDSLDLATISRVSDLPKPTALRMLRTMEETGHVRRGQTDQRWRICNGSRYNQLSRFGSLVAEAAERPIIELCKKVVWPSDIGVYELGRIRVVESTRLISPFLTNMVINRDIDVLPSAMGRSILAWSSEAHQKKILSEVENSGSETDRKMLKTNRIEDLLAITRENGYAVRAPHYSATARPTTTVSAIAVPILFKDAPLAAITLSWVSRAMKEEEFVRSYLDDLTLAARKVEENLRQSQNSEKVHNSKD